MQVVGEPSPWSRLELLAWEAGVSPGWLRGYLWSEIKRREIRPTAMGNNGLPERAWEAANGDALLALAAALDALAHRDHTGTTPAQHLAAGTAGTDGLVTRKPLG